MGDVGGLKEELGCFYLPPSSAAAASSLWPQLPFKSFCPYGIRVVVASHFLIWLTLLLPLHCPPPVYPVPSIKNFVISRYCQFLDAAGYTSVLTCDHNTYYDHHIVYV